MQEIQNISFKYYVHYRSRTEGIWKDKMPTFQFRTGFPISRILNELKTTNYSTRHIFDTA